jgi:hypothetical protein
LPESIIPSADANTKFGRVSFQMQYGQPVRLPESFRGGCSFGAGDASILKGSKLPVSPEHGHGEKLV